MQHHAASALNLAHHFHNIFSPVLPSRGGAGGGGQTRATDKQNPQANAPAPLQRDTKQLHLFEFIDAVCLYIYAKALLVGGQQAPSRQYGWHGFLRLGRGGRRW